MNWSINDVSGSSSDRKTFSELRHTPPGYLVSGNNICQHCFARVPAGAYGEMNASAKISHRYMLLFKGDALPDNK
jgi:hypothetical protein